MGFEKDYRYSILGRFISVIFLLFFSLIFYFVWKIDGLYSEFNGYKEYIQGIILYKYDLLFALSVISGLMYLIYQSILTPFLFLSKVSLAILQGGDDVVIPEAHSKEGGAISEVLKKINNSLKVEKNLVQEITQARNSLSLANLRLENKVNERTKELENALVEKTAFLNNLSHEIKAPLQGITHIVENIVSHWGEFDDAKKYESLRQAAHGSQYLLSLVANLLEIAKISDGKVSLELKNTDIVSLTKEVVEECKVLYVHNKIINIIVKNDKAIYASIDRNRIKQVLRNMLLNAIKFSNKNGSISVNITLAKILTQDGLRQDGVQVSVSDQGLGIPGDELANIFSPFFQGSNAKNNSVGTGLGLTICREIVNAHYGKIWASNNKDGGATFSFNLPISQPVELINHAPGAINLYRSGYNVLMIDDEEVCLNSMEMLLYGTEYNLIKVNSAHFALEYLKENGDSIAVIFVDLMLPDIYGINLISIIKENLKTKDIPVILQTSSSDEHEIVKAFEKGIFSFVTKPYQKKKLLEEIAKAIKYKALVHEG